MAMYVDLKTIITICGVITGVAAVIALVWKLFRWVNHQKEQDIAINTLYDDADARHRSCAKEQTLIVYGLLACLKGLQEQGCNGPVTKAINKLEKHINQRAHEQEDSL